MTVVETSVDIRAPIAAVFREITDPRRAAEWNPDIVEVRDPVLPVGVGTTWTQVMSVTGRILTLQCRIVRYDAPTYGELEVSGDQNARITTRCDELNGITRVSHRVDFVPPRGALGAIAGSVMKGMLQRELTRTAARQRETLERENKGATD
jgi:uncharacterized protein YndB with AHSA1/START domain